MDSPATLLTILTTLIGYMAVVAVIFKLFQIASELSEIKELLSRGHSSSPQGGKGEDSASGALGLESVSYAESLLRSVKAQEESGGYRGPANEDGFGDPYTSPRSRATDSPATRTKTIIRPADSVAVDDPWRERPRESSRTAAPALEAQSAVFREEKLNEKPAEERPNETAGRWTREVQRERRGASLEARPETKLETKPEVRREIKRDEPVPAHAAEAATGDKTSSQLTALNSSVIQTSPERGPGASATEWNVTTPALAPVALPAPLASPAAESASLSQRAAMPLYTPVPTPPVPMPPIPTAPAAAVPGEVAPLPTAAAVISVSPAAAALPVSEVSVPTVPALENGTSGLSGGLAGSPLASSVPTLMGSSVSTSLPPENSTRPTQPKIWPPEPVTDEALPTFLPASDKVIDWNAPLD